MKGVREYMCLPGTLKWFFIAFLFLANPGLKAQLTPADTIKDPKEALEVYKAYALVQDSLFKADKSLEISRKKTKNELDKIAAVEKAEHEKELSLAAEREDRQELVSSILGSGLLLLIIFGCMLYSRFRLAQKQKSLIQQQKYVIEEKRKEIIDSIHYARRIQNALITNEKYIDKNLDRLKKHSGN